MQLPQYINAAPAVLMVRPANFGPNPQTADSNAFQSAAGEEELASIRSAAMAEFDKAVEQLKAAGVQVVVVQDEYLPERKDAVFPNNWLSMHSDGRIFLYPMQSPARRTERRVTVLEALKQQFRINSVNDISVSEQQGLFLEGTGSLVLDYQHQLVYACRSVRTSESLAREHADQLGFRLIIFNAADKAGKPVYHTNVLMCIGTGYCVICLQSVQEGHEKQLLLGSLDAAGYEIVDISLEQMEQFAGNMLEVEAGDKKPALVMSGTAFGALTAQQKNSLKKIC